MRVAVVHDVFVNTGGAERVALTIAETLKADIFTAAYGDTYPFDGFKLTVADLPDPKAPVLKRMLDAFWFSRLDLSEYDVVWASGMWAHFSAWRNSNVLWYCHSPNRALYDLRERIWRRLNIFGKASFWAWSSLWRRLDQKAASRVRLIVANSHNTASRVERAYNRHPLVVHPPVNTGLFRPVRNPSRGFFLSVQRITPEKRLEIQIEAFKRVPGEKLVIVGRPESDRYWRRVWPLIRDTPNVGYLGKVSNEQLARLYANAKAVIQTAVDEDFGLVPVEAMASGTPVIAVDEGGFRETVTPETGVLIRPPYVEALVKTIAAFDPDAYDPKVLRAHAEKFSAERFAERIKELTKRFVEGEL